jgi:hypothetical protein
LSTGEVVDLPVSDDELREIVTALPEGDLRGKLELVVAVRDAHPDYKRVLRQNHGMVI